MPRVLGVIPARFGSTRFPGKPLALIAGKPMIQYVYESAMQANLVEDVIVATDDERIRSAVHDFGGNALMTSSEHETGTDRLVEAAGKYPDHDIIVNIQGDEPGIEPRLIDGVVSRLLQDELIQMSTAARPFFPDENPSDPNRVKVVMNSSGSALYFSRSLIPYDRNGIHPRRYLHLGIYAYTRKFLFIFPSLEESVLEKSESLEQLRALENGYGIGVHIVENSLPGVDTPDDLIRVETLMKKIGRL